MKNLIFVMCFALLGCETVLRNTDDLANVAIANEQVMSGQVAAVIKSASLSDTEKMVVDHAINEYSSFVARWKDSISELDATTPTFSTFMVDYEVLITQYKEVERIVGKHWTEYPARNKVLLADYQSRAKKINNSIDGLLAAGQRYQVMLDALALGRILAGIALKP